jgi:ribosomal-protein-alanine N-acetyltransferase
VTVTFDELGPSDAARCAELEAQLFDGDDPWPAAAFLASSPRSTSATSPRAPTTSSSGMPASRGWPKAAYEYEIHTIGVDPAYQGRGLGREMLVRLLEWADGGASISRCGRTTSLAIAMYEKAGFVTVGLRKRYYRVSGADAYTMRREPT